MKKVVKGFLSIGLLLLIGRLVFNLTYKGKEVNYQIKANALVFDVKERAIINQKAIDDYFYIEITINDIIFNMEVDASFRYKRYVVEDIYYISTDNYKCILPIFSGQQIKTDVLCQKDNVIYHYQDIANEDSDIDMFVESLNDIGYNPVLASDIEEKDSMVIYKNNLVSNHSIVLSNYKGIYIIDNNNIETISLFKQDVYKQPIHTLLNHYYIVADYNKNYQFSDFLVINILNGKQSTISSRNKFSFDTYIQGIISGKIYMFDPDNIKQYEMDIKGVKQIGNEKNGIKVYSASSWEEANAYTAVKNEIYFSNYEVNLELEKYDVVHKVNDIYYLYKKVKNGYGVYHMSARNMNLVTYAFHINEIDRISYLNSHVYYIDGDVLKRYQMNVGNYEVLTESEFTYNKDIGIWIYEK